MGYKGLGWHEKSNKNSSVLCKTLYCVHWCLISLRQLLSFIRRTAEKTACDVWHVSCNSIWFCTLCVLNFILKKYAIIHFVCVAPLTLWMHFTSYTAIGPMFFSFALFLSLSPSVRGPGHIIIFSRHVRKTFKLKTINWIVIMPCDMIKLIKFIP